MKIVKIKNYLGLYIISVGTMSCKLFKSSTYGSQMLQNLYDLWQAECFCDVEIVCDGQIFKVHRMVLSASSSYFRAMFTGGMAEERKGSVELKTISAGTFSNLLSFIYTGIIYNLRAMINGYSIDVC